MKKQFKGFYANFIDEYRAELRSNPAMPLAEFCRQKGVETKRVSHWLTNHNLTITQMKLEAQVKNGTLKEVSDYNPPGVIYSNLWEAYVKEVKSNNRISISKFCVSHGVNLAHMYKWMSRHNLSKSGLLASFNSSEENANHPYAISPEAQKRFAKALKCYKRKLQDNPDYSLRLFCTDERLNYDLMNRWMNSCGITIKQLKMAVMLEDRCPRKRRNVFVQFKPNGGTNGDRLLGVKILTPDGSTVMVEECTVISLCSFILQYNSNQKKKVQYDV